MEWRWKYFSPAEVLSPDGQKMLRRNNLKLQGFALDNLEKFREFVGKPIYCNHKTLKYRGYRSAKENRRIKGVPDSQHCQGIAFDLNCYSIPLSVFAVYALLYTYREMSAHKGSPEHQGFRGLGIYPKKNFIHVDFRTLPFEKENYVIVFNQDTKIAGTNKGPSTILDMKQLNKKPEELLELLKKKLYLPRKWSM